MTQPQALAFPDPELNKPVSHVLEKYFVINDLIIIFTKEESESELELHFSEFIKLRTEMN